MMRVGYIVALTRKYWVCWTNVWHGSLHIRKEFHLNNNFTYLFSQRNLSFVQPWSYCIHHCTFFSELRALWQYTCMAG